MDFFSGHILHAALGVEKPTTKTILLQAQVSAVLSVLHNINSTIYLGIKSARKWHSKTKLDHSTKRLDTSPRLQLPG